MLLESLCPEIEARLKPHLRGLKGLLAGAYLPQNWVFETEIGTCTLFVDTEGNVRAFPGCWSERDVTIQWNHTSLAEVLESRGRVSVPSDDYPKIIVHTSKGGTAFDLLRKELGL
jgi:hypothetical protein